ncbi:MAG: hypothetical protein ACTHQE_13285 [Thermomicrobiales bacterium]
MRSRQGRTNVAAVGLILVMLVARLVGPSPALAQTGTDLPGMIGDGEYESPQFGTTVSWTDAWELGDVDDPNVAHAIGGYATEPVVSDPTTGDVVFLSDTDSGTAVITLSIAATGITLDDLTARMETDAFLEGNLFMEPGAEILSLETRGDTTGLLVRDTGANGDHALYFAVMVPADTADPTIAVAIDLFDPATYAASLAAAEKDLTIQGFDLFATQSVDDLLGLLGEESGSGTGTRATPTEESSRTTTTGTLSDSEYLEAVREDTDLRKEQLDRLQSILFDGGTVSAAENRELEQILGEWEDLEPIAAPDEFAEIDDEHRALVKNLKALGSSLLAIASGDLDDEEQQQQVNRAGGALQTAIALVDELDDSLNAEGA